MTAGCVNDGYRTFPQVYEYDYEIFGESKTLVLFLHFDMEQAVSLILFIFILLGGYVDVSACELSLARTNN